MKEINVLPRIIVPDSIPSAYDVTSMNVIEQTGKVYAAVRELQEYFNSFMSEVNQTMTDFQNGVISDQNEFEEHITKIMHDYIHMIDDKIALLETSVENGISKYMEQALQDGRIVIGVTYDSGTESLNVTGGVE